MSRWADRAFRLRWLILVLGVACTAAGIWWALTPLFGQGAGLWGTPFPLLTMYFAFAFRDETINYALDVAGILGIFLLTQWVFLRPSRYWGIRLTSTGRPMKLSVIIAALAATFMTTGLVATILEIPKLWGLIDAPGIDALPIWIAMAIVWVIWSIIFFIYWRHGDHYTKASKMIRGLLAGSCLEMVVSTGVYAWNPHKEDCYCARGSYTGLVLGGTVMLWAFGPGIILLFLRERYRRAQLSHICANCGYDLSGTVEAGRELCPECGEGVQGAASG